MLISQGLYIFLVSSSIIGLTIACISCIVGGLALCKIIGLEKSTHQIQYVPVDEEIERANAEYLSSMNDDWATPSSVFEKDEKIYKKQMEELMPDFMPDEEEKKTRSF